MLQPVEGIKQGGRSVQSRLIGGEVSLEAGKRDAKGTIQSNQPGYTPVYYRKNRWFSG
jgi:hypothetical protein